MSGQRSLGIDHAGLVEAVVAVLEGNGREPLRLYFLDSPSVGEDDGAPIRFEAIDREWFAGEIADSILASFPDSDDGPFCCETCGSIFLGEYHSASDTNETGRGLVLCAACAAAYERRKHGAPVAEDVAAHLSPEARAVVLDPNPGAPGWIEATDARLVWSGYQPYANSPLEGFRTELGIEVARILRAQAEAERC